MNESRKITARGSRASSISVTRRPTCAARFRSHRLNDARPPLTSWLELKIDLGKARQPHQSREISSFDLGFDWQEIFTAPGRRHGRHLLTNGVDNLLEYDKRAAIVPMRVGQEATAVRPAWPPGGLAGDRPLPRQCRRERHKPGPCVISVPPGEEQASHSRDR